MVTVTTKVARDKHFLHSLGLLQTKKKGDLRGAIIIGDPKEIMLAMNRFQLAREHPDSKTIIAAALAKSDPKYIGRLTRTLRRDPVTLEHLIGSRLRLFLLSRWLGSPSEPTWPPLCTCSDPVIAKIAEIRGFQQNVSDKLVRKNWERLGLRKASTIECWSVHVEKVFRDDGRFPTVVFDRNRARE